MNMLFQAINRCLGSQHNYVASEMECRALSANLGVGERCTRATNFSVSTKLGVINILECIISNDCGNRHTEVVVTYDEELVYKYFVYNDGSVDVEVDVDDGIWKPMLIYVSDNLSNTRGE